MMDRFLSGSETVGEIGKGESSRRIGPGNTAIAAVVAKGQRVTLVLFAINRPIQQNFAIPKNAYLRRRLPSAGAF
jgi:hypothetical protein